MPNQAPKDPSIQANDTNRHNQLWLTKHSINNFVHLYVSEWTCAWEREREKETISYRDMESKPNCRRKFNHLEFQTQILHKIKMQLVQVETQNQKILLQKQV